MKIFLIICKKEVCDSIICFGIEKDLLDGLKNP
jgi:hypothetical protein